MMKSQSLHQLGAIPIPALEETPVNALAYMFTMSALIESEHDNIWQAVHNAVRGIGCFYTDLQDHVCADCCPTGKN